ncbi:hypothetical protein F4859DRAFT_529920 [Xylaria cf. heliscus]|nr:hypothetical protein F4859DRAFT_529920 [Xylaria cf. heliscus]
MRLIIFTLGALAAPQLGSGWPTMPYRPYHHHGSQAATKAVSFYTGAHTTETPTPLNQQRTHKRGSHGSLTCTKKGAQCMQFPPDAPENETISVRVYCHPTKRHHHHHHHHHKDRNNGTEFRAVLMYPCPEGTRCRVNALPRGYCNPRWLCNPFWQLDDSDPYWDADADSEPEVDPDSDLEWGVTIFDTLPGDASEEQNPALPWWNIAFTCVHPGYEDDE